MFLATFEDGNDNLWYKNCKMYCHGILYRHSWSPVAKSSRLWWSPVFSCSVTSWLNCFLLANEMKCLNCLVYCNEILCVHGPQWLNPPDVIPCLFLWHHQPAGWIFSFEVKRLNCGMYCHVILYRHSWSPTAEPLLTLSSYWIFLQLHQQVVILFVGTLLNHCRTDCLEILYRHAWFPDDVS